MAAVTIRGTAVLDKLSRVNEFIAPIPCILDIALRGVGTLIPDLRHEFGYDGHP